MDAAGQAPALAVAQLVETLGMGGAERLAVQIANARAAAGERSHLYVMDGPGPLSGSVDPRVAVSYLGYERASVSNPPRFAASLRRGYRLLASRLADDGVRVVQTHLPGANFWGLLLAMRKRCAVVATVHNNREFDYGDADRPVRARLRRWAYRQMLRRCALVVAVSDKVADSLLEELGVERERAPRLVVVPNGVPEPEPLDAAAREAFRSGFGCRPGELLLLAAGRHCEQKDFRTLIDAAALLAKGGPPFRAVIAGEGPLLDANRRRAEERGVADRLLFPGNLADLARLMQAADAFILPSLWEGLPLVLLEALAAGTPFVGTRIAGVTEVVTDGETGLLADPGDAASLAAAVARLADPALRTRLSEAGRALVRRRFSFARVAEQLDAHYVRVAAADRSRRSEPGVPS